ncbi:MAG: AAA family ATPase [Thermodesulfobacteriota bacterium]
MVPRISLLQVKNYKSLQSISVRLEPFTLFVGPNGSGKSNLFDAMAFIQECIVEPPEIALKRRAGILSVIAQPTEKEAIPIPSEQPPEGWQAYLDRSTLEAPRMGFRVVADLSPVLRADYSFEMAAFQPGVFVIARERCVVENGRGNSERYETRNGKFTKEIPGIVPALLYDRLALPVASATDTFRPVYDFLATMRFYSIVPDALRSPQEPDPGYHLRRDGSNAAAVLKNLNWYGQRASEMRDRVVRLLSMVAPGLESIESGPEFSTKETLWFQQRLGDQTSRPFRALSMSDGTLRVLGILLAVYQYGPVSVVGIEEPEITVHPALAEMIMEVLIDASQDRQILITTHSPDILDFKDLKDHQIRVVNWHQGQTRLAPVSGVDRQAIRERLYSPGELLRTGELDADEEAAEKSAGDVDLFGPAFPEDLPEP